MNKLQSLLESGRPIVLDGAMGTMLMAAGLNSGWPPEEWNVSHPEEIRKVHRLYIESGSDIVLTCSFGGTSYRLKLHKMQDRVHELNKAAAANARTEADAAARPVLVAGSIGPTGELLEPMGTMKFEEAVAAFADQARGLVDGGVDILWVETMSDLEEVRAAVEGIRSVTDLPICATMSFDTNGRTMMGVTPAQAVRTISQWDVTAIGGNCGTGIAELEAVIDAMHRAVPDALLIAKANAGIPQWKNNELIYDAAPPVMGRYAQRVRALGAGLIGGCCGNTPDHIRSIAEALQVPVPADVLAELAASPVNPAETTDPAERQRTRRRPRD